jgi:hypothetical protein
LRVPPSGVASRPGAIPAIGAPLMPLVVAGNERRLERNRDAVAKPSASRSSNPMLTSHCAYGARYLRIGSGLNRSKPASSTVRVVTRQPARDTIFCFKTSSESSPHSLIVFARHDTAFAESSVPSSYSCTRSTRTCHTRIHSTEPVSTTKYASHSRLASRIGGIGSWAGVWHPCVDGRCLQATRSGGRTCHRAPGHSRTSSHTP